MAVRCGLGPWPGTLAVAACAQHAWHESLAGPAGHIDGRAIKAWWPEIHQSTIVDLVPTTFDALDAVL